MELDLRLKFKLFMKLNESASIDIFVFACTILIIVKKNYKIKINKYW